MIKINQNRIYPCKFYSFMQYDVDMKINPPIYSLNEGLIPSIESYTQNGSLNSPLQQLTKITQSWAQNSL